jgi:hypothetical protein
VILAQPKKPLKLQKSGFWGIREAFSRFSNALNRFLA